MIGSTLALLAVGIFLNRQGMHQTGEFFKGLAFPVSMLATLPMYLRGQSWRVYAVLIGGPFVFLCVISYLAVKL